MAMIRTYTETIDLNTEQDCPTILGIHTPLGSTMYRFLQPCFKMYKKFKYLGADVTVVNAARLPVDPEQIGKIAGTNYISPNDTLDPMMFKGCHGESMGRVLDSMYDGALTTHASAADKEVFKASLANFFYTALGDDTWRKSPIQKTLSLKGLHPLVYELSTQHQIAPTNNLAVNNYKVNNPEIVSNPILTGNVSGAENGQFAGASHPGGWDPPLVGPTYAYQATQDAANVYKSGMNSMFTSRLHRLGWLDTMQFIGSNVINSTPGGSTISQITLLPKVMMGILMLPPAHLCRQYLRVIIRHKIKFAKFRGMTEGALDPSEWDPTSQTIGYVDWKTGNVDNNSKEISDRELDEEVLEDDEDGEL